MFARAPDILISPETIALVRDRTDIVAIISEAVPSLKKKGRTFVGLCPFHKEKTGSFNVNPDRGFFHCFGCKESGSAIDFVMKHDGYTFPEAVRMLAERVGIAIEETRDKAQITEADRQKKAKDDLYAVNQLAATYFEEQLRTNEHRQYALDELAKRGLVPGKDAKADEALQAFRIGYAPAGWDGLASYLKKHVVSPTAAETVGLLVPRSSGSGYYDRFRHRLMFAVVDPQGRVVAFSGRALADVPDPARPAPAPDQKPAKYINSPESPIYTKGQMLFGIHQARHSIRQAEEAICVEGNFDVLSLHARGITNVVAPLGTAFTTEQAKLLKRFAPSIVFLFDGDAAGKKAVRLSRTAVREAKLGARVATLPNGIDPDELAREKGSRAIEDLVASAKGMLEALMDMALDDTFVSSDAHERLDRLKDVLTLINDEEDFVVQQMAKSYSDMLAGRLDIVRSGTGAFEALERKVKGDVAKSQPRRVAPFDDKTARIAPKPPGSEERKAIVGALVEYPVLLEDPDVEKELAHLEGPSVVVVAALRRAWNPDSKSLDTDAFLSQIPASHQGFAARHLADPAMESESAAKGYLLDNAKQLKRLLLSQEAAQITREMYRAQGDSDAEFSHLKEAQEKILAKRRT